MNYYLGIDGGGTKTKVCVIDEHENILFIGASGPTSIDTVDREKTLENIMLALTNFYTQHEHPYFQAIFAGIGGIVFESDYDEVQNLLRNLNGVDDQTIVIARNDMENALYSGLCFDEGMTLICGTGMVAYGKDKFNKFHKSGGWGFKEGDLGSGYDLGFKALRHVIKAYDGRLEKNEFSIEVAKMIGLQKPTDFVNIMNERYLDRTWIAQLAPLVTKHANQGNLYAKKIVDEATDELALSVHSVYNHLSIEEPTLVIVGSLGNSKGYFMERLNQKIRNIDKKIKIIEPVIDPAHAAALMAKRLRKC
ncbi:MAG: BadF/BadG/BcrA/BcrD ATPase family protein [Acholeplasmataceae bacterium]|nr:BadF/BadG/BcrA/BcrD ATPase family protein [Acholeplasmataceae bacterium]